MEASNETTRSLKSGISKKDRDPLRKPEDRRIRQDGFIALKEVGICLGILSESLNKKVRNPL